MGDAAHVGSLEHTVFGKPLRVEPRLESWDTPSNYREFPDGDKLPDKMKVWRVQDTGQTYGGVVSRFYGFTDSPDTEIIASGYNGGKEYGAVGIGRHGNVLQWGFSAPPSQMTKAGQRLFLNCMCYIHRFDRTGPLVRKSGSHRMNAIRLADLIDRITDEEFFTRTFPAELQKKYYKDPEGLVKYYRDNVEFIYRDKVFVVDHELKALGIRSNREMSTLEQLVALLNDGQSEEMAKKLLARYTKRSFATTKAWQAWLEKHRDRIYFSDVGGYKFLTVPEGYITSRSLATDGI